MTYVVITQEHIGQAKAIALRLAQTSGFTDADELISESLVSLWDLALKFDPSLNVPFTAFVTIRLRFRLIDWLRSHNNVRTGHAVSITSLDDLRALEREDDREHLSLIDPSPSPCDVACSRDEFARLLKHLGTVSEKHRQALLWPIQGSAAIPGVPKGTTASRRRVAKQAAARAIGRPLYVRRYSGDSPTTRYMQRKAAEASR